MKQFIKTSTGLSDVDRAKVKVYDTIADAETALANGELEEGDIVATRFNGNEDVILVVEELTAKVAAIENYIPSDTSATNTLVNQDMLSTSQYDDTELRELIACKFDTSSFNTFYNNEYTSLVTAYNNEIACRVQCCDFTDYQTTVGTCFTNVDTSVSCLSNCVGSIESDVSDLQSCTGLSCTGTVTSISCNGTTCSPVDGVVSLSVPVLSFDSSTGVLTITE